MKLYFKYEHLLSQSFSLTVFTNCRDCFVKAISYCFLVNNHRIEPNPILVKTLCMSRPVTKKIDVFLSINRTTVNEYFNPHDPAPIYKRQLRRDMIAYLS